MDRELIKTLVSAVVRKIAVTFPLTDLSLELEVGSTRVCWETRSSGGEQESPSASMRTAVFRIHSDPHSHRPL